MITAALMAAAWLFWSGEYRFICRDTTLVKARVTRTSFRHLGRGYYKQNVFYGFSWQGDSIFGRTTGNKRTGLFEAGQMLRVEVVKDEPQVNRRIP